MKTFQHSATLFLLLGIGISLYADAPAWPRKTGPSANGVVPQSHAQSLPVQWNESKQQNIAWKTKTEGVGYSTPVIGNGRVWFTSATEDGTKQFVYCLDAESGEVLHHKLLFENPEPEPLGNPVNSYASPSCFLTEDAVVVHFGTYGTAKLDAATADVVWQRRDVNCRHFRGPGSSPELFGDMLVLTYDGIDKQFLTALSFETGKTVWVTNRTTDYGDLDKDGKPHREGDLRKAFSTPAILRTATGLQVVSVGSRAAYGYDLATGKELWGIVHDDYNAAAQPLMYGNTVILNTGSRGANLLAVKLDQSTRGDVTESHVVWDREKGNSRLCFPLLFDDSVYSLTDNGVLSRIDAKTGDEKWTGRIGGNFVASPVIANGRLYAFDEDGRATVVDANANKFEILTRNLLEEGGKASPAVADGSFFVRTLEHVYRITASE